MSSPGTLRPGRRVATRPRRAPDRALAAIALLTVAALAVLATTGEPEQVQPATSPVRVLVEETALGCPGAWGGRLPAERTEVLLGSAPVNGLGPNGAVDLGAIGLGTAEPTKAIAAHRGSLLDAPVPRGGSGVSVRSSGDLAAGLFAFQVTRTPQALAVAACPAPRSDWWFSGAGATLDHSSRLVLDNVDTGPAVIDLRFFGRVGPLETTAARGITVPPGERVSLPLADLVPQEDDLTVHVHAHRGQVVAAMADSFAASAGDRPGVDWVPAQPAPSRSVRVTGLVPRAERQTLLLANPSNREALVEVQVSTPTGRFSPTGFGRLSVPPGTVVRRDVDDLVADEPSALLLQSPVRVLAAVRSAGASAVSYATGAPVLAAPAVAPVTGDATTRLLLSAGDRPALVTVAGYAADGTPTGSEELELVPHATTTWRAGARAGYVTVTPRAGDVFGAVVVGDGGAFSAVPLRELPLDVRRPSVRPGP